MYNLAGNHKMIKNECINSQLFDTRRNESNKKFYPGTSEGLNLSSNDLDKCMFNWDYVTCKDNKLDKLGNNTIEKSI